MTTLQQTTTEVEIKGALYSVEAIPAGECGVSAARVTKLVNGESYDVIRTKLNVVECSCPDFVCRHENKGTMCKHGAAMVVRGFLPTTDAPSTMPGYRPAPVTPSDVKRARFFGLTIPAPAVALVEILTPAPVAVVEAAPIVEANPRDSWPDWTDEGTWELGPEPEACGEPATTFVEVLPSVDLMTDDAPHGMEWVKITPVVSVLRSTSPDHASYPARPEVAPSYSVQDLENLTDADIRLEDEIADINHEMFHGRKPDAPSNREPRPTYRAGFEQTLEQDAERLGYTLGRNGEPARAPKGWSFPRLVSFYGGFLAGQADLESEVLADLAWIEERNADAFADPMDRIHPAELTEFGGSRATFQD